MKITELKIDRKSIGKSTLLVDVVPIYKYENGKRTDLVEGYRYICALPERSFDKISVKIIGEIQIEKPDGYVEVTFEGLELFIYWVNGEYQVGANATAIKQVTHA